MYMLLSNQNMPDLSRYRRSDEQVRALYEYVYSMHQEINHVLQNLDEGNFGKSFTETLNGIKSAKTTEQQVQTEQGTDIPNGTEEPALTLLDVYPVGSLYMSVNKTSPAVLFGGTWKQIKDRFLLAAGSTYVAGGTGGEANHKLTEDEMPSHAHNMEYSTDNGETWSNRSLGKDGTSSAERYGGLSTSVTSYATYRSRIGYTGGGKAHNNMPPYLAVYVWQRTA